MFVGQANDQNLAQEVEANHDNNPAGGHIQESNIQENNIQGAAVMIVVTIGVIMTEEMIGVMIIEVIGVIVDEIIDV